MTWSGIVYKAYNSSLEQLFVLDGTYRKRIQHETVAGWGIDGSGSPPVLTLLNASDGLTGDYNVRYTYCRREKGILVCESNPSPYQMDSDGEEDPLNLPDEDKLLAEAENPVDAQVNAIRFYRTEAGGSTYYFDTEMSYGAGTFACIYDWEADGGYVTAGIANRCFYEDAANQMYYIHSWEAYHVDYIIKDKIVKRLVPGDNVFGDLANSTSRPYVNNLRVVLGTIADASLGSEVSTNHNRPPGGGTVIAGPSFNGICFIIKEGSLYHCLSKQPEYWPLTYYLDVSSSDNPGLALVFHDKQPYFITRNKIYYISGTGADTFYPVETNSKTGTQSVRGCLAVEGMGIFHVGSDGIYLFSGGTDAKFGKDEKFTQSFNRTFRGDTVNGVPGVGSLTNSWLCFWQDKLYFGYVGASNTYPADILVFDFGTKRTSYMNVVDTLSADVEFICGTVDEENNRLLLCDSAGYVWHMESSAVSEDNEVAINWECESKEFTLQTRSHFPRWAKWDVDASDEDCTATGTIYLDGSSQQTHSLTEDRNTKRRLIATGNGKRMSLKMHGSGPVEIYAVEAE